MSRIWITPGLLSSVRVQIGSRRLLNPGYSLLTCVFRLESGSELLLSHPEHTAAEAGLLTPPTTERLCKTHVLLGSSICCELLGQDLYLAKELGKRVAGFIVQFKQRSLKLYDWRDKLSVVRGDLFILLLTVYNKLVLLKCWGYSVSPWWAHVVQALESFSQFWRMVSIVSVCSSKLCLNLQL